MIYLMRVVLVNLPRETIPRNQGMFGSKVRRANSASFSTVDSIIDPAAVESMETCRLVELPSIGL